MQNKLSTLLNHFLLRRKFRKIRKKHGALSIRIASVIAFLDELQSAGIRYAVLRWPDKVPIEPLPRGGDAGKVDERHGDVDILLELEGESRRQLLEIAARHYSKSGVSCEFYDTCGSGGFCYKHYPYYPPIMARALLATRIFDPRGFFRLTGLPYIASLAYHVVYHKAAATCASTAASDTETISAYLARLAEEAKAERVPLPVPLDLNSLNRWLTANGYEMPYDLKIRWPRNAGLLTQLAREDEARFSTLLPSGFNYFCIFILRDDLEDAGLTDKAIEMISAEFEIRQIIEVPKTERRRLASHLRGGNWMEGKHGEEILPCTFLICNDPAPQLLESPLPQYPHLDNGNLRRKITYREKLSQLSGKRIYGVHSSDNAIEAGCVLDALKREGFGN